MAGKPPGDPLFLKRQNNRLLYRKRIRECQGQSDLAYTNDQHDLLLRKKMVLRFGIAGDLNSKRSINVWESRAVLIATLLPTSLLNIVMHSGATMWIVCGSLRINTLSLREKLLHWPSHA